MYLSKDECTKETVKNINNMLKKINSKENLKIKFE